MRFLADENFPKRAVDALRDLYHEVVWARTDCPGINDRVLLERAEAEGRVILTLDRDFWQIALQRPVGMKHGGVILFRLARATEENLMPLVNSMLRARQPWIGHLSIITSGGIEMIPAGRQSL